MSTRANRRENRDWLTGNVQFRDDGEQQAESHMPGRTRYTIAEVPEEWRSDWLLRGPDHQSSFDHAGGVNLTRPPAGSSRLRDSPPGMGGPAWERGNRGDAELVSRMPQTGEHSGEPV